MSSEPTKDPEGGEDVGEGMDSEDGEDPEDLGEEEEEEDEEEEDMDSEEDETEDPSLQEKIVWLDIQVTGLDVDQEAIMEVAIVVTNSLLNVLVESPNLVLKVEDNVLNEMKQPYKDQHSKTGLLERCKKSDLSLKDAEDKLMEFLVQHTEKDKAPLAGNSVHADKKKFLVKYLPRVMDHLQDRVVDVKSVKDLCKSWYPDEFKSAPITNESNTEVLEKVRESIEELKYYKATLCNAVNVQL